MGLAEARRSSDGDTTLRIGAVVLAAGASITQVTYEVGYDSPSGFAAMFRRAFGVPPSQYLKA